MKLQSRIYPNQRVSKKVIWDFVRDIKEDGTYRPERKLTIPSRRVEFGITDAFGVVMICTEGRPSSSGNPPSTYSCRVYGSGVQLDKFDKSIGEFIRTSAH